MLPYTPRVIKLFEGRKSEIEARKEEKRKDALGIKERLEEMQLTIVMPAGANGKLYGAVTNQTITDELAKQGINVERKRIEIPGNSVKSVGKYKFTVKLYGNASAEMTLTVQAAEVKTEGHETHAQTRRQKHEKPAPSAVPAETAAEPVEAQAEPAVSAPETADAGEQA